MDTSLAADKSLIHSRQSSIDNDLKQRKKTSPKIEEIKVKNVESIENHSNDEDISIFKLSVLDWVRMFSGFLMLICFVSYMSTETYLFFGYNGKYIKPGYIKNLITRPNISLTLEELSEFNGTDPSKPIYISINGTIWDVSDGHDKYGSSGAYNIFAGREISRALATNCMDHLSYDLRDIEPQELRRLNGWKEFFDHKYWTIGHLEKKELVGLPPSRAKCLGKFGRHG